MRDTYRYMAAAHMKFELSKYNAKSIDLVISNGILNFESEEDAVAFILKWS